MSKIYTKVLITAVLLMGCGIFESSYSEVQADLGRDYLTITNGSPQTIHYAVFERVTLASINWSPGSSGENRIDIDQSEQIHKSEIFGYEEGDEVVVYYWYGDFIPGMSLEHLIVR